MTYLFYFSYLFLGLLLLEKNMLSLMDKKKKKKKFFYYLNYLNYFMF